MSDNERPRSADFLYEVGHLKRSLRSGWNLARMNSSESVADHSFRAAIIALLLAHMTDCDVERAVTIALLHDLPETRLGDLNHLTKRYIDDAAAFQRAFEHQIGGLSTHLKEVLSAYMHEWTDNTSAEARVARDADTLDAILHVRENLSARPELERDWIDYLRPLLSTPAALQLLAEIEAASPDDWWTSAVKE